MAPLISSFTFGLWFNSVHYECLKFGNVLSTTSMPIMCLWKNWGLGGIRRVIGLFRRFLQMQLIWKLVSLKEQPPGLVLQISMQEDMLISSTPLVPLQGVKRINRQDFGLGLQMGLLTILTAWYYCQATLPNGSQRTQVSYLCPLVQLETSSRLS